MRTRWTALPAWAVAIAGLAVAGALPAAAQQPVTLEEAISAAVRTAPELAAARADSATAGADLRAASEYPNPALALGYSESVPNYHVELEQPLEYPWVRAPRISGAAAALEAARLRANVQLARIRYRVTAAYVQATLARKVATLSARQADAAAQLFRIARQRRDAGDVADLDVDLAAVEIARVRSDLITDSLHMTTTILELQSLMGLPVDSVRVVPADTVPAPLPRTDRRGATPSDSALALAAGEADRRAAEQQQSAARRARLPAPALRVGFEQGDPSGAESGTLPTVGFSIPVPLFNRSGAAVAAARARTERARADLDAARREATLALALAHREWDRARARLGADQAALEAARRGAERSTAAYREGAYPLASVLEAHRAARTVERRVLEDLAALRTAEAALALARIAGVRP